MYTFLIKIPSLLICLAMQAIHWLRFPSKDITSKGHIIIVISMNSFTEQHSLGGICTSLLLAQPDTINNLATRCLIRDNERCKIPFKVIFSSSSPVSAKARLRAHEAHSSTVQHHVEELR